MAIVTEGDPTTISLKLENDDYTVLVGSDLLTQTASRISELTSIKSNLAAIVTDTNVGPLYAKTVEASLNAAGIDTVLITVPAGEASKGMERL